MFLLIDECCGKSLVRIAEELGHTAQRTIEIATLGRGATDAEIIDFARRNEAITVTNNSVDFLALAAAGREHPGMILVPNLVGKELARLFRRALPTTEGIFAGRQNMFVTIDPTGGSAKLQAAVISGAFAHIAAALMGATFAELRGFLNTIHQSGRESVVNRHAGTVSV